MKKRKSTKMTLYKKSLLVFISFLILLMITFLIYIYSSVSVYEHSDIDNYMKTLIQDIKESGKDGKIDKYFKVDNNKELISGYKKILSDAKMDYKKTNNKNEYDIFADDKRIATILLDDTDKNTKLGLLTYINYDMKKVTTYHENGLYNVEIELNSDYDLYINDKKINSEKIIKTKEIEYYKEVSDKTDTPKINVYNVENLFFEPKVVVKNKNGQILELKRKGNKYYVDNFYRTDNKQDAKEKLIDKNFDIVDFAKKWSLFLTNDLKGTNHGLNILMPNLYKGTSFYNKALAWATNVDIQFTSNHRFDKEPFTNIKVSDYKIYNEKAFSVKVYLEKNMILSTGAKRKDTINDEFYCAYIDGNFRILGMKSISK